MAFATEMAEMREAFAVQQKQIASLRAELQAVRERADDSVAALALRLQEVERSVRLGTQRATQRSPFSDVSSERGAGRDDAAAVDSLRRMVAALETEKRQAVEQQQRARKELEDTKKRMRELEQRIEANEVSPLGPAGIVEMEAIRRPSATPPPPAATRRTAQPPAGPVSPSSTLGRHSSFSGTGFPSRASEASDLGDEAMTAQRAQQILKPLLERKGAYVQRLAEAVLRFVEATAPAAAARAFAADDQERNVLRAELNHVVNILIDLFSRGARKHGGGRFFGLLGEPYHAWDCFAAFASAYPTRGETGPAPTRLFRAVEANVRTVPANANFGNTNSARSVKDAKFHSLIRAALNERLLAAALKDLFERAFPVLTPLLEDDALALHPKVQRDVVAALEPLAAVPCAYSLDLLDPAPFDPALFPLPPR